MLLFQAICETKHFSSIAMKNKCFFFFANYSLILVTTPLHRSTVLLDEIKTQISMIYQGFRFISQRVLTPISGNKKYFNSNYLLQPKRMHTTNCFKRNSQYIYIYIYLKHKPEFCLGTLTSMPFVLQNHIYASVVVILPRNSRDCRPLCNSLYHIYNYMHIYV